MDLFLSILITLFLVGVVLSIVYTIVGFVLEKKSQKQTPQEETHQEITLEEPKKE